MTSPDENLITEHWKWHTERHPEKNVGFWICHVARSWPVSTDEMAGNGYQNAYNLIGHGEQVIGGFVHGKHSVKRRFLEETGETFDERSRRTVTRMSNGVSA